MQSMLSVMGAELKCQANVFACKLIASQNRSWYYNSVTLPFFRLEIEGEVIGRPAFKFTPP